MSNLFCLNQQFSTTRKVTKQYPHVKNSTPSKIQTNLFLSRDLGCLVEGGLRKNGYFKTSTESTPLVTIITVVYNGEKHLEQTISSVLKQTYENIEYIVIDGGSTDRTLDIIRKYENAIDYWVSGPDNGISDAFNKGIMLANGDYIQILNSDDWLSVDQVQIAVNSLNNSNYDFVYGDLTFHDDSSKPLFVNKGEADYGRRIHREMPNLNHPSVLAKRRIYEQIGSFDLDYKIAMDYEWFLRAHEEGFRGKYLPNLIGHQRRGGLSDLKFSLAHKEVLKISLRYGYNPFCAYPHYFYRITRGRIRRLLESMLPLGIGQKVIGKLK